MNSLDSSGNALDVTAQLPILCRVEPQSHRHLISHPVTEASPEAEEAFPSESLLSYSQHVVPPQALPCAQSTQSARLAPTMSKFPSSLPLCPPTYLIYSDDFHDIFTARPSTVPKHLRMSTSTNSPSPSGRTPSLSSGSSSSRSSASSSWSRPSLPESSLYRYNSPSGGA
ncbi:hypothetical protein C8J57DRAFT_1520408 [Mycena rebaudengoi]|nr:hypothetical protein C8J57DRAFT_1520408 [Mycena rebaudengoi]